MNFRFLLFPLAAFAATTALSDVAGVRATKRPVDLFIGTEGSGHVTPAATVPFGMIQAGPDTGVGKWNYVRRFHRSVELTGCSERV